MDFNPFNDLQAEDRCHRIGQKKPVTVIKLVTQDTVDQDIYAMQQRKAEMNAAIMENAAATASLDNKWNQQKEKEAVIQTTVQRFLLQSSPTGKKMATTTAAVGSGNDEGVVVDRDADRSGALRGKSNEVNVLEQDEID